MRTPIKWFRVAMLSVLGACVLILTAVVWYLAVVEVPNVESLRESLSYQSNEFAAFVALFGPELAKLQHGQPR